LSVEQGDFFALLGSNGAGKTTAIGIICGLLNKTQGDIQILGLNQNTHVNDIKRLIGKSIFLAGERAPLLTLNDASCHLIKI
jgi:ABC-type multidrug transport system ATPase subunit